VKKTDEDSEGRGLWSFGGDVGELLEFDLGLK
jgi:hypothetical protein